MCTLQKGWFSKLDDMCFCEAKTWLQGHMQLQFFDFKADVVFCVTQNQAITLSDLTNDALEKMS